MFIRKIQADDAKEYGQFLELLYQETNFLLWEPEERSTDNIYWKKKIQNIDLKTQAYFVTIVDKKIVGFIVGFIGGVKKISHRMDFTMGVLNSHQGKGIGKKLLISMEAWVREKLLKRIELTVMAHNKRAIKLYESSGYQIEGKKIGSIIINNIKVDELMMGKLLT